MKRNANFIETAQRSRRGIIAAILMSVTSICGASVSALNVEAQEELHTSTLENRKEISQYGVTWTFDKEYPCGQFANGDW